MSDEHQRLVVPGFYFEGSSIWDDTATALMRLERLIRLARQFRDYVRETRRLEQPPSWPRVDVIEPLPHVLDIHEIRSSCRELRNVLADFPVFDVEVGEVVGSIRIVTGVTPILRGFLEHVEEVPLIEDPSPPAMRFLAIAGFPNEKLVRDHHDVGWHHHYCDRRGRRSDTLLAFDTNQPGRFYDKDKKRPVPRALNSPMFWERHSEANAKFPGRADAWGKDKRCSVFEAAQPELVKRRFEDFRRPKNEAQPVWPTDAVLSVRPTGLSSASAQSARGKKHRP